MKDEPPSSHSNALSSQNHSPSSGDVLIKPSENWFRRLFKSQSEPQDTRDILDQLNQARQRGLFDQHALTMIEGVFEVAEMRVRDIMIPRAQMTVIEFDQSFDEILKLVVESGHSRFPVIGDDKDELFGVLLAKDLLKHIGNASGFALKEAMREAVIVPESKRLNTLLNDFRSGRNHMAMVVDEYGGVSGLVTIEDVLEVIVGEIGDEHDAEESENIRAHQKGHYSVDALTEIEDFNEHFGVELSDEEAGTVGGYVMRQLGHLPKRGEQLESNGLCFTVLGADSRRLYRLKVTRTEDQPFEEPKKELNESLPSS